MNLSVHIPMTFENVAVIHDYLSKLGLSYRNLTGSNSFEVIGEEVAITKFQDYLKRFEMNEVYVLGLGQPRKSYIKKSAISTDFQLHTAESSPSFTPKDLATIYGLTKNSSERVNIALIELGGGYQSSDLDTYWNYLELTTKPNVYSIAVDGVGNTPGSDADGEVVLDIEVIGGICPNSNIYVYFTPNTDQGFYDAIHTAIYSQTHPVKVISISWGSAEDQWDEKTLLAFNSLFKAAANLGITICVASGDNGSSDGESSGDHADFPSSSPWVLSCGGTRLTCPTKNYSDKHTKEVVWGTVQGNGASGGGFSSIFPKPSYQTTLTSKYKQTGRGVPDVCGDADPETGWIIYLDGQYTVIGGTSAVAPMWAGYLASIHFNQFLNPILYSLCQHNYQIVHDILIGNEGSFSAAKGWDPASGLGSPNGKILTPLLLQKVISPHRTNNFRLEHSNINVDFS
jgi:kumamolisin